MTTVKPDKIVCATCQSWHGVRRFNARIGLVELDPNLLKVSELCSMCYKKPGLTPATSCRGFVKWCKIPDDVPLSPGSNGRKTLKLTALMVALCVMGLCVAGVVAYLASGKAGDLIHEQSSGKVIQQSPSVVFDPAWILLPNEWKFDVSGRGRCLLLDRIGDVKLGDEICEVTLLGHAAVSGEAWPCVVRLVLEPIDAAEFYVSDVRSVSIGLNKSLEAEIVPLLRLYCGHLQKTLMKK